MAKRAATRATSTRRYWLFKTEPGSYSLADLEAEPTQTTGWDGVRNYQARNLLRDDVRIGDGVLFYHSNVDPLAIVGTARVVGAASSDPTAFDPHDSHYDPKSDRSAPTWFQVQIQFVQTFAQPIVRETLRECAETADMMVLRRGSRLSVQPVTATEWQAVHRLAGARDRA